jgi:cell division protein FtsB
MSNVRGRRGGAAADGRRSTGRVHATRPVHTASRSAGISRPGQRRSARRRARASSSVGARRRPLFTGRAVLLGALVLLLALTLAGPIRQFLAGRAELVQLAAEGSRLDRRADELTARIEQQADQAWTERQARERLTYVVPGDRLVVVVDGRAVEEDGTLSADSAPSPRAPWYEGLLRSVAVADGDPPEQDPGSRPGG